MTETGGIDITAVDPARRYNALLGGKDNFAVDRASAQGLRDAFPAIEIAVRESRRFLCRAVRHVAVNRGIRQFLDIGVGFPDVPNVHEIAQAVDPTSRVLYVDHDPLVAVHARALLTSTPEGASEFVKGDLLSPDEILASDALRDTLDFNQPVGLILSAVLHFCTDDTRIYPAVRTLTRALPADSYVVLSHATFDPLTPKLRKHLTELNKPEAGHGPFKPRTRQQVAAFLNGLQIEEPGLVSTIRWHPNAEPAAAAGKDDSDAICYAAVAKVSKAATPAEHNAITRNRRPRRRDCS